MKEPLVSVKTAFLAKEKGFQIPVCQYINRVEPDRIITVGAFNHNYPDHGDITVSMPSQSLLQKWLRDKFNIHIKIIWVDTLRDIYTYHISTLGNGCRPDGPYYRTYEATLDEGLFEALKLISDE